MTLQNYVKLEAGVPATMHFTDHAEDSNEIRDPKTGLVKTLRTLVFVVDQLNGVQVGSTFSVSSDKLYSHLLPHLADKRYRGLLFNITRQGREYLTEFQVRVSPFQGPSAGAGG